MQASYKLDVQISGMFCTSESHYANAISEHWFLRIKGGRTPTASRQASRHETKETKADVSIMTQTGVRRFS
jgi:hypothetical protein